MAIKDKLFKVLCDKKTVITRAILWNIPHNSGKDEICLKLGRYKKDPRVIVQEILESVNPKSELTLDETEFLALIDFLRDNYEPFKQGFKAFIPLDRPYDVTNASQIRALFSLPEKTKIVDFILKNNVIPEELELALKNARRTKAIREFEKMLPQNFPETIWQKWFKENSWILGSEFVRILDERTIDVEHISDFLLEAYDGFLDIIEIKRPQGQLQFWSVAKDHDNHIPSQDLVKAITQSSRYLLEIEREANSTKFLKRTSDVQTIKPRCILIFGRSHDWNDAQREAYRILNSGYHNLTIMTYDHVLQRAKRILGLPTNQSL